MLWKPLGVQSVFSLGPRNKWKVFTFVHWFSKCQSKWALGVWSLCHLMGLINSSAALNYFYLSDNEQLSHNCHSFLGALSTFAYRFLMFVSYLRFGHLLSQEWNIHLTWKITPNPSRLWLTFLHAYNLRQYMKYYSYWSVLAFFSISHCLKCWGFPCCLLIFLIEIITVDFSTISNALLCRLSQQRLEPSKTIFWFCDVRDYLFTWVVVLSLPVLWVVGYM